MRIGLLLDTGFLYGLRDEDDPNHTQSLKTFKTLDWNAHRPILTTDLVVNETYTLMNARSNGKIGVLDSLNELFWGKDNFFRVIFFGLDDFQKISALLVKYSSPNKILSFVDASLIYLSQLLHIREILSFDVHFDGILIRTK